MFTGIIEECGRVLATTGSSQLRRFEVSAAKVLEGTQIGDSIAVSGVCLTVVALSKGTFSVEAVPETLRRSSLGARAEGDYVNLERAMTPGRFFGGHYVQGHVDATATIHAVEPDGDSTRVVLALPKVGDTAPLARYFVSKGYATLEGASLTVVDVDDARGLFDIRLIPHTLSAMSFGGQAPGELATGMALNLEIDVVAKYVERFVGRAPAAFPDAL